MLNNSIYLPTEILSEIFKYSNLIDLSVLSKVTKEYRGVVNVFVKELKDREIFLDNFDMFSDHSIKLYIIHKKKFERKIFDRLILDDRIDIAKWIFKYINFNNYRVSEFIIFHLFNNGKLETIKWLYTIPIFKLHINDNLKRYIEVILLHSQNTEVIKYVHYFLNKGEIIKEYLREQSIYILKELSGVIRNFVMLKWLWSKRDEYEITFKNDLIDNALEFSNIVIADWLSNILKFDWSIVKDRKLFEKLCPTQDIKIIKYLWEKSNHASEFTRNNDQLFYKCCYKHNYPVAKWLCEISNLNIKIINNLKFDIIFRYGSIDFIKWLWKISNNKLMIDEKLSKKIFANICKSGILELVKILLEISNNKLLMDSNLIKKSFINACASGNLELVKFLWKISNNKLIIDSELSKKLFIKPCTSGNLELAKFLWEILKHIIDLDSNDYFVFKKSILSAIYKDTNCIKWLFNTYININNDLPKIKKIGKIFSKICKSRKKFSMKIIKFIWKYYMKNMDNSIMEVSIRNAIISSNIRLTIWLWKRAKNSININHIKQMISKYRIGNEIYDDPKFYEDDSELCMEDDIVQFRNEFYATYEPKAKSIKIFLKRFAKLCRKMPK